MGIAAAGVQAKCGRFMGVAAQSDHRIGGVDIQLRIRQKQSADSTLLREPKIFWIMSQAQQKGQLVLLKQFYG